jgi:hypothetical protein
VALLLHPVEDNEVTNQRGERPSFAFPLWTRDQRYRNYGQNRKELATRGTGRGGGRGEEEKRKREVEEEEEKEEGEEEEEGRERGGRGRSRGGVGE